MHLKFRQMPSFSAPTPADNSNDLYVFFDALADRFGLPTRHLSTDRWLRPAEGRRLLEKSGLALEVDS
jgi:hypothetical protein